MALADHDANDVTATLNDASNLLEEASADVQTERQSTRKRVMMSGCVDLMHSGHVACFAEASKLGDLYFCLGSDKNIELLKHKPMIPEQERLYMVKAIRYVHDVRISRGSGDLDWLTEVDDIKPDIFFVNEDGDRPAKREACQRLGIKYVVGKREPAEGLEARSSTDLKLSLAQKKNTSTEITQPEQRPQLIYFDGRGRADPIRFVLEAIGLEYDDVFLEDKADFQGRRAAGELDFNQVPMLRIAEGDLVQSRAIIAYLSHRYGLNGTPDTDPLTHYHMNEIYEGVLDFRNKHVGSVPFRLQVDSEQVVGEQLAAALEKWAPQIDRVLARAGPSPFLAGTSVTFVTLLLLLFFC